MNKKYIFIPLIVIVFLIVSILILNNTNSKQKKVAIPDPNIELQSKSVNGMTFTLRNVNYSDKDLTIGYEVVGASMGKNDLVCRLYYNGKSVNESTGGKLYELGSDHYYLTAGIDKKVKDLPEKFELTVEILARPEPVLPHDISVKFNVPVSRE